MRYIITEEQFNDTIKKFKKDDVDRGELGRAMEELVIDFMKGNLCDVVAIKTRNDYIVLILTEGYYTTNYKEKISKRISNFLGTYPNVMIQQSPGCEKMEEN